MRPVRWKIPSKGLGPTEGGGGEAREPCAGARSRGDAGGVLGLHAVTRGRGFDPKIPNGVGGVAALLGDMVAGPSWVDRAMGPAPLTGVGEAPSLLPQTTLRRMVLLVVLGIALLVGLVAAPLVVWVVAPFVVWAVASFVAWAVAQFVRWGVAPMDLGVVAPFAIVDAVPVKVGGAAPLALVGPAPLLLWLAAPLVHHGAAAPVV